MPFSIDNFLFLANKLELNFGVGPCIGFDIIRAVTYLCNVEDQFTDILSFISSYDDPTNLAKEIEEARLKLGILAVDSRMEDLLTVYDFLVSIEAICALQYQSTSVNFIFEQYQQKKLIFSHLLDRNEIKTYEEILILKSNEITELFNSFLPLFELYSAVYFCIESHDHDIFLRYDVNTALWELTDTNDFDGTVEDYSICYDNLSIADALMDSFADDEACLMKIKLLTTTRIEQKIFQAFTQAINKMAKINTKKARMVNSDGLGLLYLEAERGNLARVTQLLNLGANPDQASSTTNIAPSFVAFENGHLQVLKKLILWQININRQGKNGDSLLHVACENEHEDIVHFLINNTDIDINLLRKNSISALHIAVYRQNVPICQLLLEKKINTQLKAKHLGTPLQIAEFLKNKELVSCLTETSLQSVVSGSPKKINTSKIKLANKPAVGCAFHVEDCHRQNHSLPMTIKPSI